MVPPLRRTLIIFGGLPGTGKTAVSSALAKRLGAVWLRIDVIEQSMRAAGFSDIGPAGYIIANALAEANLKLGMTVVADCVNPVAESRRGWRETAARASARLLELEIVCSDPEEHRARVEGRMADIPGHCLPTWHDVIQLQFESWDGDHLVLDTAGVKLSETIDRAEAYVRVERR